MSAAIPAAPPAPAEKPRRELVSSWHLGSMERYLDLRTRHAVARVAAQADRLIADGVDHLKVMLALAGAESIAPDGERHLHAARTDAYAALHGLRGWYRYTSERGEPRVAVNKLRTPADGEVGRYYVQSPFMGGPYCVSDRDTGAVVARAPERRPAEEWIARAEGRPLPGEPKPERPVPDLHWSHRSIQTVDVLAEANR